jgi:hypothetical protein
MPNELINGVQALLSAQLCFELFVSIISLSPKPYSVLCTQFMERPIGLVWVNAPKKPRAKCRRDENWEILRPQILQIFSQNTWNDAVIEVEKLGLTGVT